MTNYKSDDLGFDLEIRNNIFVTSQIYPKQKKIVVSFLEELGDVDYPAKPVVKPKVATTTATSILDNQDDSRLSTAKPESVEESTEQSYRNGFLQKYRPGAIDKYDVQTIPEALKYVVKRIRNVVKSVKNYRIEFENLATIDGFYAFSKRYGINDDFANLNKTEHKKFFKNLKVVYDTDGDYDANRHGLRIGYNSSNYDETMIAHYLGDLFYDHLYHSTTEDYYNLRGTKPGEEKINKYVKKNFRQTFYDAVINKNNSPIASGEDVSPSTLTVFNNTMFEQKHMSNALGNQWDLGRGEFNRDLTMGLATYGAWERSNRFIDVAKLNPKFITLKRCAMALGYKIQESDTNRDPTEKLKTLDQIADLIAYNINDVYVTLKIFESNEYYNRFKQNQQLLKEFRSMVYEQNRRAKKKLTSMAKFNTDGSLNIKASEDHIRFNRMTINSTSTKLVENAIAPYPNTKIQDNETLNLNYPDEKIAQKLAATGKLPKVYHGHSRNVLEVIQDLLDIEKKSLTPEYAKKVQTEYDKIVSFYSMFIGKNFNSDLLDTSLDPIKPSQLPQKRVVVRYVTPHGVYRDHIGNGLASYVNISVGGTHGVEVLQDAYQKDLDDYHQKLEKYDKTIDYLNKTGEFDELVTTDNLAEVIANMLPDEPFTHVKRMALPNELDGTYGDLMTSSSSRKKPRLRKIKEPELFELKNGVRKLKDIYSYTSSDMANHEDFDSYYPSLISNLAIFRNADGEDIFTEQLYHPRLKLKKLAKDHSLPENERLLHMLRQLSMKLLINAASGGGDASFTSKIKCNNKMLAMRIIGQLFCWFIGQSLAMHDARIPSTNTDGLYSMNIDKDLNDKIVMDSAQQLLLKIDPEVVPLFVSKDANNRLEKDDRGISSARGGSLTSWRGPSTQNSIAHPAIVDYLLANYLADYKDAVNKEFDRTYVENLLNEFIENKDDKFTSVDQLRYLQFPIVANPKTARFLFEEKIQKETDNDTDLDDITLLNATNRVYMVDPKFSDVTIKSTGLQVVQAATVKKDRAENPALLRDIIKLDKVANYVIKANLTDRDYLQLLNKPYDPKAKTTADKPRDLQVIKITDFPSNQAAIINNEDLNDMSDTDVKTTLGQICKPAYLDLIQNKFETQWQNSTVTQAN